MGKVAFFSGRYKKTHGRYTCSFFSNITRVLPLLVTVTLLLFPLLVIILKCSNLSKKNLFLCEHNVTLDQLMNLSTD